MDPIEEIKRKLDIVEYINARVPLKKTGRNFKAVCPFHSEKTASFVVSPERQIWYCFGACGEGGDIIKFAQKYDGLEFREALEDLARVAGVDLSSSSFKVQSSSWTKKKKLLEINHLAGEYFHFLLTKHQAGEKARRYLKERKIDKGSIKLFKLGFAPEMWDGLYQFLVEKKKYEPKEVEEAGLIVKKAQTKERGHYDRFRGRVMFPLKDQRGNIVGFAGRLLDPKAEQAKYVNTPETLLYHKSDLLFGLDLAAEHIRQEKKAIVVEGEIDMIQSFQNGVKNVVAIKGSALTMGQLKLLKRYTENLYLALDADLAGDQAARRGIELAENEGFNLRVVRLLKGKDPDECIRQNVGAWKKSIKKAMPIYDFVIDSAKERVEQDANLSESEKKKKITEETAPFLAKISNVVVRAYYVKKLAEVLGIDEEVAETAVAQGGKVQRVQAPEKPGEEKAKKTREEMLGEYLLSLVLQAEKGERILAVILAAIEEEKVLEPRLRKIFKHFEAKRQKKKRKEKGFKAAEAISELAPQLRGLADRAYLQELNLDLGNEEELIEETVGAAFKLKGIFLKKQLKEIGDKLRLVKKESELEELNQEFKKISQKIQETVKGEFSP